MRAIRRAGWSRSRSSALLAPLPRVQERRPAGAPTPRRVRRASPSTPAGARCRFASSWRSRPTSRSAASCSASTSTPTPGCCSSSSAPRHHVFWMKNTLIPLDMIFIGADRRIVGHRRERRAEDADRARGRRHRRSTCWRSAAGCPRKLGIRAGQLGRLPGGRPGTSAASGGVDAADAGGAGGRAAVGSRPGLRAEVRRHPRARCTGDAGARRRKRAAGRDRVARRQRQDRAVPGGGARARRAGARRRAGPRPCSTARSSRWTPTAQPAGFQRIQDRIHLTGRARDRARARRPTRSPSSRSICCATGTTICARCRWSSAGVALGGGARAGAGRRHPPVDAGARRRHGAARARRARAGGRGWWSRTRGSPYRPGRRSRGVAQAEAGQARGVRRRRLHRAARRARPVRRAAARACRGPAGACASPATSAAASPTTELERVARRARRRCETRDLSVRRSVRPANEKPHWVRPELVAEVRFSGVDRRRRSCARRSTWDCATTVPRTRDGASRGAAIEPARGRGRPTRSRDRLADKPPSRAAIARVREQIEALAERGGGTAASCPTAARSRSATWTSGCGRGWASRRRDLLPLLPGGRAVSAAGRARSAAGHAALARRRRRARVLPARAPDDVPARRARGRRSPATTSRRGSSAAIVSDAALHGPARGHLAGPVVLARAVARTKSTSPPSISIRWTGRRSRACATSRAGCATSSSCSASTGYVKTSGARGLHIYLPMRPGHAVRGGHAVLPDRSRRSSRAGIPRRRRSSARSSAARSPAPSTSTACRTASARRWPAPTARAPATSRARRRRSRGTSSTTRARPARLHHPHAARRGCATVGDLWAGAAQGDGDRSGGGARARPGQAREVTVWRPCAPDACPARKMVIVRVNTHGGPLTCARKCSLVSARL